MGESRFVVTEIAQISLDNRGLEIHTNTVAGELQFNSVGHA
jgi:hypothetical protein